MRRVRHATFVLVSAALITMAACGDDGGENAPYPETFEPPTSDVTAIPTGAATPEPTRDGVSGVPNEGGEAPIFWRTEDDFQSVTAGQAYTVNFRIASGYDEPTLTVIATCVSCEGTQQPVAVEGLNSPPFPAGSDLPGSYYPMNIVLPVEGRWELFVQAGAADVTVPIDVKPSP